MKNWLKRTSSAVQLNETELFPRSLKHTTRTSSKIGLHTWWQNAWLDKSEKVCRMEYAPVSINRTKSNLIPYWFATIPWPNKLANKAVHLPGCKTQGEGVGVGNIECKMSWTVKQRTTGCSAVEQKTVCNFGIVFEVVLGTEISNNSQVALLSGTSKFNWKSIEQKCLGSLTHHKSKFIDQQNVECFYRVLSDFEIN